MGLSMRLQNQLHENVHSFADDSQGTVMRLADARDYSSMLGSISPHGDTIFNSYQLQKLILELAEAFEVSPQPVLKELAAASEQAIRLRGYILFMGD